MSRRLTVSLICAALVASAAACSTTTKPAAPAAAREISIKLFAFHPARVVVARGARVRWSNGDQILHTVTSGKPSDATPGAVFDGTLKQEGATFEFVATAAGTFDYFCRRHPTAMMGQIVVT